MATVPDTAIAAVRALCDERLRDADHRDVRLDVEVEESAISIIERHAPFMGVGEWTATPLAQLRLEDDGSWTMYPPTMTTSGSCSSTLPTTSLWRFS